ncbi:MAG TPA: choice-of-anchor tandem repeat GloVer-containing protein [Candidatus Cybelea sp.]|nr:choice-of-anchor tandem repeat GloVer-containing protein [Candidatus Cybelea sp.]
MCIIILAGCANLPASTSSLPSRAQQASGSAGFQTLHIFDKQRDGIIPVGRLLHYKGTFYGTTNFGGDPSKRCYPALACGTVYKFDPPSAVTVLYRFTGKTNGTRPYAGVINVNGVLYGTTQDGGTHNEGTVFAITTAGDERVAYSFGGKDGNDPRTSLTSVDGVLYGTTYYGGKAETGTVFRVTTSGTEKVLHSFIGGDDGALPLGAVVVSNGVLYGTTASGGANDSGTVFAVAPDGSNYRVLYSFQGGTDGAFPFTGLTELNGTLYGTTEKGGAENKGTVFSITPSGSEAVIHNFGSGTDGFYPYSGLTVFNGELYGTTAYGGTNGKSGVNPETKKPASQGTIYTITPSGSETVIHNFTGGPGGRVPYADLTVANGTLYGTTIWGGNKGQKGGTGTLFDVAP